jgi:hypothetical protein
MFGCRGRADLLMVPRAVESRQSFSILNSYAVITHENDSSVPGCSLTVLASSHVIAYLPFSLAPESIHRQLN